MHLDKANWGKAIFWGAITGILYAGLFGYSDLVLHMAHTTPDSCVVGEGAAATYFHHVDAAACAARGGHLQQGVWWHVLLPILIALAVSFVHGAFTGLFWDLMGLKPASRANGKH